MDKHLCLLLATDFSSLRERFNRLRSKYDHLILSPHVLNTEYAQHTLRLKFQRPPSRHRIWWAPVYRGLVVDSRAQHYRALHTAVWLFLYLIIHANRSTGKSFRAVSTIAEDMGVSKATIKRWLRSLTRNGYVNYLRKGNVLQFEILKWKPLRQSTNRRILTQSYDTPGSPLEPK